MKARESNKDTPRMSICCPPLLAPNKTWPESLFKLPGQQFISLQAALLIGVAQSDAIDQIARLPSPDLHIVQAAFRYRPELLLSDTQVLPPQQLCISIDSELARADRPMALFRQLSDDHTVSTQQSGRKPERAIENDGVDNPENYERAGHHYYEFFLKNSH
ncbi:hypothetical protein ACUYGA_30355 [Metapseudomonas otitidis]|uniref:hypothetical protein n=1 Tax=Metapseudomonas otitidis TaxID=319939 RepID=UPI0040554E2A